MLKELLTYLLFEASDEAAFVDGIKQEIHYEFRQIAVIKKAISTMHEDLQIVYELFWRIKYF